MVNEITQEELRSFREQGVVIFDPRKLYINIIGKDQIGNTIVRYNEEIIAYIMTSGVRVNNIIQKRAPNILKSISGNTVCLMISLPLHNEF
jgi:hypothetical protein